MDQGTVLGEGVRPDLAAATRAAQAAATSAAPAAPASAPPAAPTSAPTSAARTATTLAGREPPRPFPPSVLDRLISRIRSLPLGGWWVYLLLIAGGAAWTHLALALLGRWSPGQPVVTFALAGAVFGPYGLAAIQYLDGVASRALSSFRAALDLSEDEVDRYRFELVSLPARMLWPCLAIGVTIATATIILAPDLGLPAGTTRLEALIALGPVIVFGYTMFPTFVYHTIRQLRLVIRLNELATRIHLYQDGPLFAFSRLTMQTGLIYLSVVYYAPTVTPGFVLGNPVAMAAIAILPVVAIACFLVPLLGMHGRLAAEKARLLGGANDRVTAMTAELYRRVDGGELVGIKDVNDALTGLIASRDHLARLPTWPWPPQVLRSFVTALLLPIALYLVTRFLGQQLG